MRQAPHVYITVQYMRKKPRWDKKLDQPDRQIRREVALECAGRTYVPSYQLLFFSTDLCTNDVKRQKTIYMEPYHTIVLYLGPPTMPMKSNNIDNTFLFSTK